MKRNRIIAPVSIIAALLFSGCSAQQETISKDSSGVQCLEAGEASKSVTVTGDPGDELHLTSHTPVTSSTLQRSVLEEGSGKIPAEGDSINVSLTIFNGANGTLIKHFPANPVEMKKEQLNAEPLTHVIYEAARCSNVQQRVAITGPYADFLGNITPEEAGIENLSKKDSIVAVLDFIAPKKAAPACKKLSPRDKKYPKVDLGDGAREPKITIPECMTPPSKIEIKVLTQGEGAVVEKDQTIMTNYLGVDWNGAKRFDGNWSETGIAFSTTEGALIPGFTEAMVGQKIGSTILVTMPPEMGYGVGTGHELADKTLTFVLQLVSEADDPQ